MPLVCCMLQLDIATLFAFNDCLINQGLLKLGYQGLLALFSGYAFGGVACFNYFFNSAKLIRRKSPSHSMNSFMSFSGSHGVTSSRRSSPVLSLYGRCRVQP